MWAEPNDDVIPHLDCPLCHNQDRRFIVGTWEDPIGVARCTACGLVHTTGRHVPSGEPASVVDGPRRRQLRHAFDLYDRLLDGRLRAPAPAASALNIGEDDRGWLDQLRAWGYRAEGTESDCTDLGNRYEVVSLIDQLDLAERPAATLHFAARHLAPGGVVIIEVPNWNQRRQRSVLPPGVELGRQVAFYDRDSLRDAVLAVGLEPMAIWSAPIGLDRAIGATEQRRSGWLGRALDLTHRALKHASDASDHGAKLVMIAHRPNPDAH